MNDSKENTNKQSGDFKGTLIEDHFKRKDEDKDKDQNLNDAIQDEDSDMYELESSGENQFGDMYTDMQNGTLNPENNNNMIENYRDYTNLDVDIRKTYFTNNEGKLVPKTKENLYEKDKLVPKKDSCTKTKENLDKNNKDDNHEGHNQHSTSYKIFSYIKTLGGNKSSNNKNNTCTGKSGTNECDQDYHSDKPCDQLPYIKELLLLSLQPSALQEIASTHHITGVYICDTHDDYEDISETTDYSAF